MESVSQVKRGRLPGSSNTPLQNLSSKRNWGLMLVSSMLGMLRYLKKTWPTLEVQRAVWALEQIQEQMDAEWWDRKLAMRADLELSHEIEQFLEERKMDGQVDTRAS